MKYNKVSLLLLSAVVLASAIETASAVECYVCKEKFAPGCGEILNTNDMTNITKVECDGACVTFKNKYDAGKYVRDCSAALWVPPAGKLTETEDNCVRDKYSLELYCFCFSPLCNGNNTGNLNVFLINECATNPCVNGGNCTDMYGKFKCNCTGNYAGATCSDCIPGFGGASCNETLADPCLSTPCQNNATCKSDQTSYTYTCDCGASGFNGTNCEIDINECAEMPCKKGTCMNTPGSFECQCPIGSTGTICDVNLDECSAGLDQCSNTSTCLNTDGGYNCTCDAGFAGKYCDFNINECAPLPCNSGSCTDAIDSYTCTCYPGFEGINCDQVVDLCAGFPCVNGVCNSTGIKALCVCGLGFSGKDCSVELKACDSYPCFNGDCAEAGYPLYTCECYPGYNGTQCEARLDYCAPKPCRNGTCASLFNGYKCTCTPGFTGVNCDTEINECDPNPCYAKGGNCTDLVNAFQCKCNPGFTGLLCETNINECASSPCKNGATCRDLINGYKCICADYYKGTKCEVPVYRCFEEPEICNQGECLGGVGSEPVTCQCDPGFSGQFCETVINPCNQGVICYNNATCVHDQASASGFTCACPLGSTGTYCETSLSLCQKQNALCNNNGMCVDVAGDYRCDCFTGYSGANCETNYFSCTSQGTFADTVFCEKYINCIAQADGSLALDSKTCPKLSGIQLLYNDIKKGCDFPASVANPQCYTSRVA